MLSLPQPLQSAALATPGALALCAGEERLTYAALGAAVRYLAAAWLRHTRLAAGHTVALFGPAGAPFVRGLHALFAAGPTVLPLPYRAVGAELAQALGAARPAAVLCCGAEPPAMQRLEAVAGAIPVVHLERLEGGNQALAERFWPAAEPRLKILTSGSTGVPKVRSITAVQLLCNAFGVAMRFGHLPTDTWLACLPLHHIGGLSVLLRAAWGGSCVELHRRFVATDVAEALDSGRIALAPMVPRMFDQVLDVRPPRPFPAALRVILLGGARTEARLLQRAAAIGAPLSVSWGMTETAAVVTAGAAGAIGEVGDCGTPLCTCRVEVDDGRLVVRGANASGAQVRTSDCGHIDARGHVHVAGRSDDVIVSGGEKIVPQQIEAVLVSHPDVAEAAVVGRPDARYGARPVAYLVAAAHALDAKPTAAALAEFCAARLAAFKVPDAFIWRSTLPRSDLGKLRRYALGGVGPQVVTPQAFHDVGRDIDSTPGLRRDKRGD